MANLTPTTSDAFIPELWSTDIIRAREAKLVLAKAVKNYSSLAKQGGKKLHIPNLSNTVANDKVAGVPVSFQANTETDVEMDINIHKEASHLIEDITRIQANVDLSAEYTKKDGYALAKAMDSSLAALASGFSTAQGTYNTAITTDVILDSVLALDDADVPLEDRHFVMRPKTHRDIIDITTYTSNDFVDGRPVQSGKVGMLYGLETAKSTQIVKTGNNTNNMIFHRDALAIAVQKEVTTNSEYSVADIGWKVVSDCIFGVKEVRDDHGVLVRT